MIICIWFFNIFKGFGYSIKGLKIISQAKIRRFVIVPLSINIVFSYNGWQQVELDDPTADQKLGLRLLMSVFPAVALAIGLFFLWKFPLDKKKVQSNQEKLKELYAERINKSG